MRILLWHVHGSWTTAFVGGGHDYLIPVDAERGPDGRGRARTWDWPASAREVPVADLRHEDVDVVLLQREHEVALVREWLGREPGRDLPAVFVEHNTPKGEVPLTRHPMADRDDVVVAHVTHFNRLFWDNGRAPTAVVEHGIPDPGYRYTGELARAAVVVNEPVRRGRVTGTDLLAGLSEAAHLDVFGMRVQELPRHLGLGADRLAVHEDLPQSRMHEELPLRRVYVHPIRWTSLGLSLLEAMFLGMPVVALATTEAVEAVPREAGVLSTDPHVLRDAVARLRQDHAWAIDMGKHARAAAASRYGVERFLADWDRLLTEVTR